MKNRRRWSVPVWSGRSVWSNFRLMLEFVATCGRNQPGVECLTSWYQAHFLSKTPFVNSSGILFFIPKTMHGVTVKLAYLLGLLAMIKCSICSYQCDNWYISNWRLTCHNNVLSGIVSAGLAQTTLSVALALYFAGSSTPCEGNQHVFSCSET